MSLFKEKVKSKNDVIKDTRLTIDATHNKKLQNFNKESNHLEFLKQNLQKKLDEYEKLDKLKKMDMSDIEINKYFELSEEIEKFRKEIEKISQNYNKNTYLLNTSHILFNYYDKINTSKNANDYSNKHIKKGNKKCVLDFFTTSSDKNTDESDLESSKNIDNSSDYVSKYDIINNYLLKIEDNFIYPFEQNDSLEYCKKCNQEKKIIISEGITVCTKCGTQDKIIIESDKPSYKDPPREISYFAYKRINHFNEWLAQFQAKESTEIPKEVFDKLLLEIKKERIENMALLSPQKLREILKKLKLNKYYEHVPHIINRLNGLPAPVMTRETEEKLRMMFKEIQTPFLKYCPKDRKNFLSYSYVLHKFVQLLELDEFLCCFPLLKSREKLHQQDQIWKKICEDLHWQFIKSL